ncbi:hypothetical protein G9H61_11530 [Aquirufa ecclesiirivi]|uniref:Chromosome partition protein Smc n=1 Tax=Aquirufa ecclesiirivi TaxID=2715124 RepID=A0ABT4JIZ8_9BACT|nr:hypothetical protein [Aquirufa ecclesiirivi]MCZ2476082.1 hypothetical protein [Aquirufa ecclesiirivi]
MTPEHKQSILPQLDEFWKLEIDNRVAEVYKDYQDLTTVYIGYYSVTEFTEFSKKAIGQLGQILQSKLFSILPFHYQFQNDFGAGNLRDDLANFITFCLINDFDSAVGHLYRLVYYQVQNGLWDKDQPIDKKKKTEIIDELESKLQLIAEKLRINTNLNQELIAELQAEKTSIIQLVETKNTELSEISNLLPTARKHSDEITRLMTASTDSNQQITGLLNQQNSNLETVKTKLEEEKTVYVTFQKDLKDLKDSYKTEIDTSIKKNADFEKLLTSVLDRSSTFDQRILVLNELIGKEGAVKLFSTFNDRKIELEKPVKHWANIVFATGTIALVLIVGVFTNFFGCVGGLPTSVDWQYLIINSLKSLPVMIVLFFTIKQYAKERSFQEEYAFRSAIALTIQAYGDIAGKNKEDLISKAVASIYTMPTIMKEKSSFFSFRSKLLTDSIRELNETIKNIKG